MLYFRKSFRLSRYSLNSWLFVISQNFHRNAYNLYHISFTSYPLRDLQTLSQYRSKYGFMKMLGSRIIWTMITRSKTYFSSNNNKLSISSMTHMHWQPKHRLVVLETVIIKVGIWFARAYCPKNALRFRAQEKYLYCNNVSLFR